ncbi:clathrin heavy chain 2 [Glossophaga mutica]
MISAGNGDGLGQLQGANLPVEAAVDLEQAHLGATLYFRAKPQKMLEHLEFVWSRVNIPKVLRGTGQAHLWEELVFLCDRYKKYDSAILTVISHPRCLERWAVQGHHCQGFFFLHVSPCNTASYRGMQASDGGAVNTCQRIREPRSTPRKAVSSRGLRTSVYTYNNFDNSSLAQRLEKHQLIQFRHIAMYLYKGKN